MEPELQNHFEKYHGPYEILEELKTMFQTQARSERYAIFEKFFNCKMEEGSYVSEHAIKMSGHLRRRIGLHHEEETASTTTSSTFY
jgi:hypothetical protein